jgi:hypothetical protein
MKFDVVEYACSGLVLDLARFPALGDVELGFKRASVLCGSVELIEGLLACPCSRFGRTRDFKPLTIGFFEGDPI